MFKTWFSTEKGMTHGRAEARRRLKPAPHGACYKISGKVCTRVAVALVWLYEGLWLKLVGGASGRHAAIVGSVPFLDDRGTRLLLIALGLAECGLALWVLSGRHGRAAAIAQTALLAAMNAGGLIWGRQWIADPAGMVLHNVAFLTLAWVAVGELNPYA